MRAPVFFPTRNVSNEHTRAHYMFKSRPKTLQCTLNIPQAVFRLFVCVIKSDDLAVCAGGRGARDVNAVADFDGARITDDRLPLGAGRDALSLSHHVG